MNTLLKNMTLATITLLAVSTAYGQRGRGELEGVARQGLQPEMVEMKGSLLRTKTGPCPHTTGRAYIGTHLFIQEANGREVNIHLGPADAVKPFVDKLEIGQTIEVTGFRTQLLEEDEYVAQTVRGGEEVLQLRDEDLSPFWAAQRGGRRDRPGYGRGDRGRDRDGYWRDGRRGSGRR